MSSTIASYREVTDANNRVYRVGETDHELLGRSRAWMVWLPWAAMMAVSVYEYGYGAAEEALRDAHGWTMSETFWLLSIWAFFQAGVAFPAGKLREKGIVSARAAMLVGAVLSAIGFISITTATVWSSPTSASPHAAASEQAWFTRRVSTLSVSGTRSGEAARPGSSTADSLTALCRSSSSSATPCIRTPTSGSSTWSAVYMLVVVRRMRTALPGPAEELVARATSTR